MSDDRERPLGLVTGASRGIGLAIAHALAPRFRLVLAARDPASLGHAAARLREGGAEVTATLAADLGDPEARARLCTQAAELPIAVLVANAGIASSAPLARTDDEAWARALAVNLTAPFELMRALVPGMVRAGWGRVVAIASTSALKGYRYTAAYSASKGGLVALVRAIAAELVDKGVTANAVCAGFADTDIVRDAAKLISAKSGRSEDQARQQIEQFSPLGRLLRPEEVAALVAYLCSREADAITGQAIAIDGGETAT
jgi:NAD(P)-dependent dehydrogenase (short-subunit alcohol dehydrogenase family)